MGRDGTPSEFLPPVTGEEEEDGEEREDGSEEDIDVTEDGHQTFR